MRVGKQKRHRKVVRFFAACYGFREPYKVLCDGTFVHHLLLHRLLPADDALSKLLSGKVTLFSSDCVSGELRSLRGAYGDALQASERLVTARCDHEKRVSAATCIESIVAEGNKEHFFVATQDAALRKKLREIPGIPVIYALRNSLFLENPTAAQREFVKSAEEKRQHRSAFQARMLSKKTLKENLPMQILAGSVDENSGVTEAGGFLDAARHKTERNKLGIRDKCKFKINKPKGPNPLSCKKKKNKENPTRGGHDKNHEPDGATRKKRIRKRKSKEGEHVAAAN